MSRENSDTLTETVLETSFEIGIKRFRQQGLKSAHDPLLWGIILLCFLNQFISYSGYMAKYSQHVVMTSTGIQLITGTMDVKNLDTMELITSQNIPGNPVVLVLFIVTGLGLIVSFAKKPYHILLLLLGVIGIGIVLYLMGAWKKDAAQNHHQLTLGFGVWVILVWYISTTILNMILFVKSVGGSQIWEPGKVHKKHRHVIASTHTGQWTPAPGYVWANKKSMNDLRVVWMPGKKHPTDPSLIAGTEEGTWKPTPQ